MKARHVPTGHGRALATGGLLRRSILAGPAATIALAVVVGLTAGLAAAAPDLLSRSATAAVRYDVATDAPADQADVIAQATGGPITGASAGGAASTGLAPDVDPIWGAQEDALRELRDSLPQPLDEALGDPEITVTSDRLPLTELPGLPPTRHAQLGFGFDPRYSDRIELVSGAWPGPGDDFLSTGSPIEVVLSQPVSDAMEWAAGETRQVVFGDGQTHPVIPTGIIRAIDPDAPYWLHSPTIVEPGLVQDGSGGTSVVAEAFVNPAAWVAAARLPVHEQTRMWFPAIPDALTVSSAPVVSRQLREFVSSPHPIAPASAASNLPPLPTEPGAPPAPLPAFEPGVTSLSFGSRLPTLIDDSLARNAATNEVIAMAVSGPVGVLAGVVLLGASLLLRRRGSTLALLGARGGSPGQLRGLLAVEGAAIGLAGAAIGTAAGLAVSAALVGPSTFTITRVLTVVGIGLLLAVIPVVVLVLQGGRSRGGRLVGVGAATEPGANGSGANGSGARRIRWIADGVILLATAASIVVLAVGGSASSSSSSSGASFDPVPAAAPLLIALAVCAITVRAYPSILRWTAAWARSRSGVVAFVGATRARRRPPGGTVLVFAVVIGVGIALFSTVFLSTVRSGIESAAVADLGADISIRGQGIPEAVLDDVAEVPGVEATAAVFADQPVVVIVGGSRTRIRAVVVDTDRLAEVQRGRPGAIAVPPGLAADTGDGQDSVIPVFASAPAVADLGGAEPRLNGHPLDVLATSATAALPFTTATSWLLVDRENGASVVGDITSAERVLVRVAADADTAEVAKAAQAVVDDATGTSSVVTTAQDMARSTAANPRIATLQTALLFAIGFALLLCLGAVVMTLALGRSARARLTGLMSALGADARQNRALAVWEMAPTILIATVGGVVAGAAASALVLTLADLTAFTGGTERPGVTVDPLTAARAVAGFLVVAVATLLISTVRRSRSAIPRSPGEEG
ncbi:FtsX-like permease family protein [Herbiconiux sp. CPCC 205763]|uniref:FtsX-like permease family protein n=1 Tax=Herbiconiux aconitum TaxID=2970913 RepID=A0ABT2GVP2_9MICO|nr:FtsX-like permease family protein [Herbiconiux aconitum]MCS5719627.1 FtsX-like permease family protein [Herbiconiux aconitum]